MPHEPYEGFTALLFRAARAVARRYKAHLADLGLTPPQASLLLALCDRPGLTMGDAARLAHADLPTIFGIAERLEAMGYLRRQPHGEDRRKVCLWLTPAGQALEPAIAAARARALADLHASLGVEAADELHALLRRLCAALDPDEAIANAAADAAREPEGPSGDARPAGPGLRPGAAGRGR